MNKYKRGQKVWYINLKNEKVCSKILRYRRVTNIVFGKKIVNVVAELENGEYVNSRHLNAC